MLSTLPANPPRDLLMTTGTAATAATAATTSSEQQVSGSGTESDAVATPPPRPASAPILTRKAPKTTLVQQPRLERGEPAYPFDEITPSQGAAASDTTTAGVHPSHSDASHPSTHTVPPHARVFEDDDDGSEELPEYELDASGVRHISSRPEGGGRGGARAAAGCSDTGRRVGGLRGGHRTAPALCPVAGSGPTMDVQRPVGALEGGVLGGRGVLRSRVCRDWRVLAGGSAGAVGHPESLQGMDRVEHQEHRRHCVFTSGLRVSRRGGGGGGGGGGLLRPGVG